MAGSLNKVELIGNLGADPEIRAAVITGAATLRSIASNTT